MDEIDTKDQASVEQSAIDSLTRERDSWQARALNAERQAEQLQNVIAKNVKSGKMDAVHWYRLAAFYSEPAKEIIKAGDHGILLQGLQYDQQGEPILAVCSVSCAVAPDQGRQLERLLQANLRMPVLILTDNVKLARLQRISEAQARAIMNQEAVSDSEERSAPVIDFKAANALAGRPSEPTEGEGVRAGDSEEPETDIRPPESVAGDGGNEERER